jgi:hypothetical protein
MDTAFHWCSAPLISSMCFVRCCCGCACSSAYSCCTLLGTAFHWCSAPLVSSTICVPCAVVAAVPVAVPLAAAMLARLSIGALHPSSAFVYGSLGKLTHIGSNLLCLSHRADAATDAAIAPWRLCAVKLSIHCGMSSTACPDLMLRQR